MKKILPFVVLLVALGGLVYFVQDKKQDKKVDEVAAPVPPVTTGKQPIELCFAKIGIPNSQGFADKYTLRMLLDGGNVSGELKLLPAEKDSKTGKFAGTVSAVDKVMMARTINAWWDTSGEGVNVKEELKIIFGEGTASIGFGEMVDRGDGVYVYKDPKNISYSLDLTDVACGDITERENEDNNPVACTMEAKQCPDGSYVGRTGPNCEFAPCPSR